MIAYLSIVLAVLLPERDDERGASAVEYGLLIAGIAALIVVVALAFGDNLRDIFTETCDTVNGAEAGCVTDG
ncbi:Flp family type IVb pilin [Nocardioides sp. Leaf285]|uniref:Flp family type IVb pilin n=1 Tax=Nocardioides sp. Leaf285 TaxID=1736322 RepID=UPI000702A87D|nr:Flp family type IVb pilin [Nocardioides sp. Leaf285]KQP66706.1 hypothetical protein ASF47_02850 [Nocardioides sp. Leaf285]